MCDELQTYIHTPDPDICTYIVLDTCKHVNSDRLKYEHFIRLNRFDDRIIMLFLPFLYDVRTYTDRLRLSYGQNTKRKRKRDKGGDPNSWLFIVFDLYIRKTEMKE